MTPSMTRKMVCWNRSPGFVSTHLLAGTRAQIEFAQHYSSGQEYTGRPYPIASKLSSKIPDNDTEDSSFEHLSEIKTAAHHTIQLFGGGIDIGTTIALPPRINIF